MLQFQAFYKEKYELKFTNNSTQIDGIYWNSM